MSESYNLNTLTEDVEKQKQYIADSVKKRSKENYHYAKSLGFSSYEASVLRSKSKETIYRLSQERRGNDVSQQ